jgi:hypothetical protein
MTEIKTLYQNYHQKSKTFLSSLLGLHPQSYIQALQTYISWPKYGITPEDRLLLLLYNKLPGTGYEKYKNLLLCNTLYHSHYETIDDREVFLFSFESYGADWGYFLEGKYSKLSLFFKSTVSRYYKNTPEAPYIDSYLYPDRYRENYTRLLWDNSDIEKYEPQNWLEELCDKPDLVREECRETVENFGYLKNIPNLAKLKDQI